MITIVVAAATMTVVAIPPATKKIVPATPKVKMSLAEAQTMPMMITFTTMTAMKTVIRRMKKEQQQ